MATWRAVFELSIRYGLGIDTRDWTLLTDCLADPLRVDFSSFTRQPALPTPMAAADFVASVRPLIEGFEATQHLIGNQLIDVSGDSGRYTAYVQAQHWMGRDRWYLVGGWYDNRIRLVDGSWKLTAVVLHQTWDAGDRSLLREAGRRYQQRQMP